MPQQQESLNTAPVDRAARDQASRWIRQWLQGDISGVELEQALDVLSIRSADRTLTPVSRTMERYLDEDGYDEAGLNQSSWRHAQRLLLVLASQCHIDEKQFAIRVPVPRSWIALTCLGVLLVSCLVASWYFSTTSDQLAALWYGCGIVMAGLTLWWLPLVNGMSDLHPFTSRKQMQQVARTVPQFQLESPPDGISVTEPDSLFSRVHRLMFPMALSLLAPPFMLLFLLVVSTHFGTCRVSCPSCHPEADSGTAA